MNTSLLQCCGCAEKIMNLVSGMETATNCKDVEIAKAICYAIVCITAFVVIGFLAWKLIENNEKDNERKIKKTKEEEEAKRKMKSDLTDKLLDFLKSKATEKNNNNGQQTNIKSLSMKDEDIYKVLKENAANSCSEELRKKYIELCVEILHNLKTGKQGDGKPSQENEGNLNGEDAQSGDTGDGKPNDASLSASEKYTGVLCTLLGSIHKNQLEVKDIQELKQSCGL